MSRIRTLKPTFFKSRSMARCSIPARITFQGLWCEADDHGRGIADARIIGGVIWPLEDAVTSADVENHLIELAETDHIILYEVDGERFYAIKNWEEHQSASHRRGAPQYPAPPAETPDRSDTHDSACDDVQDRAGVGSREQGEGTGKPHVEFPGTSLALVPKPSPAASDDVQTVFAAWQDSTGHHKARLDDKRRKAIVKALKHYPVQDCIDAVRGWKHSPHHAGKNATRTVYDEITLLLRDSEHLERFRDLERGERPEAVNQPAAWDAISRVMAARQAGA